MRMLVNLSTGRRDDGATRRKTNYSSRKSKTCVNVILLRECVLHSLHLSVAPSLRLSVAPSLSRSVSQSFILSVSQSPGRTDFPEFISSRRNLPRLPTLRHHRLLIPHCHCLPPRRRHDHDRQADPDSLDHHCHLGAFAHETPGRLFA